MCYFGIFPMENEERLSVVQRADLRGTKLRPTWDRSTGKPYPPQLSNVSLSAVKRFFVSCQMFLCQLSKDGVKFFQIVKYEEDYDFIDAGHRSGDGIGTNKKSAV